jgi:uncharacterized membrane protein YphA (DoxX/SURF4 family)
MSGLDLARVVLCALLAVMLIATGGGKLAGASSSHVIRDSLRVGATPWRLIGVFELALVVLLVVGVWRPASAVVGALGVVVLLGGAVVVRLRAGGSQRKTGVPADIAVGVVALAAAAVALTTL